MEEEGNQVIWLEDGSREPEYKEVPGLFSESVVEEVSVFGRGMVLGFDILGLPTRPRLHSRNPRLQHRRRRTPTRPPNHPPRTTTPHISRTPNSTLFPRPPRPPPLDKSHLLLHPHPRNNRLPSMALSLHNTAQTHIPTPTSPQAR